MKHTQHSRGPASTGVIYTSRYVREGSFHTGKEDAVNNTRWETAEQVCVTDALDPWQGTLGVRKRFIRE